LSDTSQPEPESVYPEAIGHQFGHSATYAVYHDAAAGSRLVYLYFFFGDFPALIPVDGSYRNSGSTALTDESSKLDADWWDCVVVCPEKA
jgi:hypothetical protein